MKKIDIKGKDYVPVNERILVFRTDEEYKDWSYTTEIVSHENDAIIMRTTVYDSEGRERSNGYAREVNGSTFINKTSYVENCETSAVGRALGNLGIGIDTSVASYEEVANAVKQQEEKQGTQGARIGEDQKARIIKAVQNDVIDLPAMLKYYKVSSVDDLSYAQAQEIIKKKI